MSTYTRAGVDIKEGERFAQFIANFPSSAISDQSGGFAGAIPVNLKSYIDPVILTTTDGIGTKLLVAKKLAVYDTVGIDLVAMCANDLSVCGAKPTAFLDYIACGKIHLDVLQDVIKGIVAGCEQAECLLVGGETAEMPDMYTDDDIDLAGFALGVTEREDQLPRIERIRTGDRILGLLSNGIHSNGFSLARKVLPMGDREILESLLTPTKIYVRELIYLLETGLVNAAAHITGGGLVKNLQRVLPKGTEARLTHNWPVPAIFDEIRKQGAIEDEEMHRVFNMGIGIALVSPRNEADNLLSIAEHRRIELVDIGEVASG